MKEYKAVVYGESMMSTLMFGAAKVDPDRMTKWLNEWAKQGWRVIEVTREQRRTMLFSEREAFLFIMERDRQAAPAKA